MREGGGGGGGLTSLWPSPPPHAQDSIMGRRHPKFSPYYGSDENSSPFYGSISYFSPGYGSIAQISARIMGL